MAPVVGRSSTKRLLLPPRPGRCMFNCGFGLTLVSSSKRRMLSAEVSDDAGRAPMREL